MAKTEPQATGRTLDAMTPAVKRVIANLKPSVMRFAEAFKSITAKRTEIAPKFMQVYNRLAADLDGGLTFVDYCRMFDPSVPTAAGGEQGYRVHPTYMACDYLRRKTRERPRGRQGTRDNATDILARTIATMLQVVRDAEPIWSSIQAEFAFTERQLTALKRRVESTRPLFQLSAPRAVSVGKVIHMDRKARDQQAQQQAAAA